MLKPVGYYVLIKMEKVENTTPGGIVIATKAEHEREQTGHDVGELVSFGPNSFSGFNGINGDNVEQRAKEWGVIAGDKVEFNRYDGKIPAHPDFKNYRIIQDAHIIGVIDD